MGAPLSQSLMALAYSQIAVTDASPYLKLTVTIKAGGIIYNPLRITRMTTHLDFVNNYADETYLYLVIPQGDLTRYIAPYQDDIIITLSVYHATSSGDIGNAIPLLTRNYIAQIADQTKNPMEYGNVRGIAGKNMENMSQINIVSFRLEELLVEQLRLARFGTVVRDQAPINTAVALLKAFSDRLAIDDDEKLKGITIDSDFNPIKRKCVVFEDNTPILNVPDILQYQEGGIYKDGLGFYIHDRQIVLWSLYGLNRVDNSARRLRMYLSPDPLAGVTDRTWRIPPDDPTVLEVWIAKPIKVDDNSLGIIHKQGTGIQNVNPSTILQQFASTEDNRLSVNKVDNEMAFKNMDLITGRNVIMSTDPTTNPYKLSSKLSRSKGMILTAAWEHSLSTLIVPGMSVEVVYDFEGTIHTTNGTLLEAFCVTDSLGSGFNEFAFTTVTGLTVFVDRDNFLYNEWVEGDGAIGRSTLPQYNSPFGQ